jgi:hypothetical protein
MNLRIDSFTLFVCNQNRIATEHYFISWNCWRPDENRVDKNYKCSYRTRKLIYLSFKQCVFVLNLRTLQICSQNSCFIYK